MQCPLLGVHRKPVGNPSGTMGLVPQKQWNLTYRHREPVGNPSETRRELWGWYLKTREFDVPASETRRKPIGNFSAVWPSLEPSLLVVTMSSDQAGKPIWLILISGTPMLSTGYP